MLSDVKIKKGSLKDCLGYSEEINLQEVSEKEILKRQKKCINDGMDYGKLIKKFNWQRNISNSDKLSNKFSNVIDQLKIWNDKKKESEMFNKILII